MTNLEKAIASGNRIAIELAQDHAKREAEMFAHEAEQKMFAAMPKREWKAPTTEKLDTQDKHFEEKYNCKLDNDPTTYMSMYDD